MAAAKVESPRIHPFCSTAWQNGTDIFHIDNAGIARGLLLSPIARYFSYLK